MNVGELKKLLESFPDELDVSILSKTTKKIIPIEDAFLIRVIPKHYFAITISDADFILDTATQLLYEIKDKLRKGEINLS